MKPSNNLSGLRRSTALCSVALMATAMTLTVSAAPGGRSDGCDESDADKKVTICHVPPGNPENAHTITISECALPAHIGVDGPGRGAHGGQPDTEGECPASGGLADVGGVPDGPPPASFTICDERPVHTGRRVDVPVTGQPVSSRLTCTSSADEI